MVGMWLFYLAGLLLILAIVGTFAGAGIFSIILFPLAVIAIVAALWSAAGARASGAPQAKRRSRRHAGPSGNNLPHRFENGSGAAPTSPDSLVDARLEQQ
jgi:uncharacterized protein (DUF58 family)